MSVTSAISETKQKRFSRILSGSFPYGFRVGSMIDRNRFKSCYVKQYGSELENFDEDFSRLIRSVGILREDRIFSQDYSDAEAILLKNIFADISQAFKAGARCVYFSELYKKYSNVLTSQVKVFSMEAFVKILFAKLKGRYSFNTKCVYVDSENGTFEEIDNFIRASLEPVTPKAIHKKLWYIPVDVITRYLKSARPKEFVRTAEETYFYAPNLPVTPEELEQIQDIISDQLELKGFTTAEELREIINRDLPSPAMSIENFSNRAFCSCLSSLMKDYFAFNGSLISSRTQPLNIEDIFREFCRGQDELSLIDLESFAQELHQPSIRWNAVFDVMLRISKNKFVQCHKVNFNVPKVDKIINQIFGADDYLPLSLVNRCLDCYPEINDRYYWNQYLLESYVARFSWEFDLVHMGYSKNSCSGAIVRKNSGINNFQTLITRVLADSSSWQTRDEAVDFLVREGYLKSYSSYSRSYFGINAVISELQRRDLARIA